MNLNTILLENPDSYRQINLFTVAFSSFKEGFQDLNKAAGGC